MTVGKKKTRIVRIGKVPLNMPNRFRSTGYKPPRTPTLSRTLPFFSGDPGMVTSVEERDKQIDAARRVQKYNAKIYSKKEQTLRAIHKLRKQQQEKQWKKKVIQYLSEQDWRDGFPDYVPMKLRKMAQKLIDERNAKKQAEAAVKGNKGNQRQSNAPLPSPATNGIASDANAEVVTKQDEDDGEEKEETPVPWLDRGNDDAANEEDAASGMFSESGYGIMFPRTKRLHDLIHVSDPGNLYYYLLSQTPEQREKVVANWRRTHRDDYAKLQKSARGVEPPQKMIERAFPKWAVPYDVL